MTVRRLFCLLAISCCAAAPATRPRRSDDLTLPPGFKAEVIYRVPKETQGSWISMTADPRGRLIASDQYGGSLYRVTSGADAGATKIEKLDVPLGSAHGLCWAGDSLYVVVNGAREDSKPSGLYRVRALADDADRFQPPQLLRAFKNREGKIASGEHGVHAVHAGPDGRIYVIGGNGAAIPEPLAPDSPAKNWNEELLLPRITDHLDPNVYAPGGWLARTDPDGKTWQLMCTGLRNCYDFGFSADGETLTFDSDMEWDVGTPWYRPTRITHLVSGGEYGWRNGSAKWPEDYPDSLPPVLNVGFASPTGIAFGRGLRFPTRWQNAMFLADWAYGRIYAATLTPAGASYHATIEIFAAKRPMPLTALVANPVDGALYALTGGRGTQSELLRFTYVGSESTAPPQPVVDPDAQAARDLRHKLESFHGRRDPGAIDFAWPYLGSSDPYIRFAARVAIEWQDVSAWRERALHETDPARATAALVALARCGDRSIQPQILDELMRLEPAKLSQPRLIDALRACELCFIRTGRPTGETATPVIAMLDSMYPSSSFRVNRELCQLLAYLDSPTFVAKTVPLLQRGSPREQLMFALVLRSMRNGWTLDQRRAQFAWLNEAEQHFEGGFSMKLFFDEIRDDAIKTMSDDEKHALGDLVKAPPPPAEKLPPPRKFVRHWTPSDVLPRATESLAGRSFARGRAAFEAVSCLKCHKFGEEGSNVGPALTTVGNRFSAADLLEAMVSPSKDISDQYASTDVILKTGKRLNGWVDKEDDTTLTLRENPLSTATISIPKNNIARRDRSKLSTMPDSLLDVLSLDEILDMVAYLRSGGNPQDEAFSP